MAGWSSPWIHPTAGARLAGGIYYSYVGDRSLGGKRNHFLESHRRARLPICATEAKLEKYPDVTRLPQWEAERARS